MKLYPDLYLKNAKQITIELLHKYGIKGLILDIDNTLIDFNKKMIDGLELWCEDLKKNNIKICILSNTNKIEKVKKVAEVINVPYIYFARKPSKIGFKKAKEILALQSKDIAVVGDQILTDVWGRKQK